MYISKVSKGAKIRNRCNQVTHLTQDTNWKVTNSQYYTIKESHYGPLCVALYTKKLPLLAGNCLVKIRSVACGFSQFKIYFSDYPKSLNSRIN